MVNFSQNPGFLSGLAMAQGMSPAQAIVEGQKAAAYSQDRARNQAVQKALPALIAKVDINNPTASLGTLMQSGVPLDVAQQVIGIAQRQAQQASLNKSRDMLAQELGYSQPSGALPDGNNAISNPAAAGVDYLRKAALARSAGNEAAAKYYESLAEIAPKAAENAAVSQNKAMMAQQAIDASEALKTHAGFEGAVGAKNASYLFGMREKPFAGTDEAGFEALRDQLKGKVFLQGYEMLKGGGPITDVEGKKAEDALARLDTAQNEKDFLAALNDFQSAVSEGAKKLGYDVKPPSTAINDTPQDIPQDVWQEMTPEERKLFE